MSRSITLPDNLEDISEEDLLYLAQRGQLPPELEHKVALDPDTQQLISLADYNVDLADRPNTGTVNTKGLTIEDLERQLEKMRAEQAPDESTSDDEEDEDEEDYQSWTNDELRAEISRRNQAGSDLSLDGKKADLIATLEADDEANPEAEG